MQIFGKCYIKYKNNLSNSQKLGNNTKMSFFQIFQSREFFVEILSQVKDFLRNIKDLVFSHFTNCYQSSDNIGVYKILFL